MLLEENFEVVSVDASAKMLMYAKQERLSRQPLFNKWGALNLDNSIIFLIKYYWHKNDVIKCLLQNFDYEDFYLSTKLIYRLLVIEEANWLNLYNDIMPLIKDGFDAVICLGNSFALLHDNYGDQREQKSVIGNFEKCIRPGGMLLIDHRNFDQIIATESTPSKFIYYNVSYYIPIIVLFPLYPELMPLQCVLKIIPLFAEWRHAGYKNIGAICGREAQKGHVGLYDNRRQRDEVH